MAKREANHDGGSFETRAVHAGQKPDPTTGAIMTPVHLSSTYVQEAPGKHKGYEYSRTGNPTRSALEANLASLEGARFGLAFASGLAATDTVAHTLKAGDHVLCGNDLYGGTHRLFTQIWSRFGLTFTFVDTADTQQVADAVTEKTRLLWLESPTNPLLRITDIRAAAEVAHQHGLTVVVDNTFATPFLQRPLELGADLVLHSTTKYLGGHSDIVGGALVTRNEELHENLKFLQNAAGAIPGAFDSWLVLRGIKTLHVRMERHCANAAAIAAFLAEHPKVERVYYPGLPEHPNHGVAAAQMSAFGGMVSFELTDGVDAARRFVSNTNVFALAESLGGVESLIESPAVMTHAAIPAEERRAAGLADGLIRLSVGIEGLDDLLDDLKQAFDSP